MTYLKGEVRCINNPLLINPMIYDIVGYCLEKEIGQFFMKQKEFLLWLKHTITCNVTLNCTIICTHTYSFRVQELNYFFVVSTQLNKPLSLYKFLMFQKRVIKFLTLYIRIIFVKIFRASHL